MHVFVVSGVCLRGSESCRRRSAARYNGRIISVTGESYYTARYPRQTRNTTCEQAAMPAQGQHSERERPT